jgi:hypothetical protein
MEAAPTQVEALKRAHKLYCHPKTTQITNIAQDNIIENLVRNPQFKRKNERLK